MAISYRLARAHLNFNNTGKVRQPVKRATQADIKREHPCNLYSSVEAAVGDNYIWKTKF